MKTILTILTLSFLGLYNSQAFTPSTLVADTQIPLVIEGKTVGSMTLKAHSPIVIREIKGANVIVSRNTEPTDATFTLPITAVDPESVLKAQAAIVQEASAQAALILKAQVAIVAAQATPAPNPTEATPEPIPVPANDESWRKSAKFNILLNGHTIEVMRVGNGSTGVIFFNHSGGNNMGIHANIETYKELLISGYSFFFWEYPTDTAPFNEINHAIETFLSKGNGNVSFSNIASSVVNEIKSKAHLSNVLIVGDSLGAGIVLQDYQSLSKESNNSFLLISPTQVFSPNPSDIGPLTNTVLVANEKSDMFVKNSSLIAWISANKKSPPIQLPSGHLIIDENLTHKDLVKLIKFSNPTITN